jgi:hypothetical protein
VVQFEFPQTSDAFWCGVDFGNGDNGVSASVPSL